MQLVLLNSALFTLATVARALHSGIGSARQGSEVHALFSFHFNYYQIKVSASTIFLVYLTVACWGS